MIGGRSNLILAAEQRFQLRDGRSLGYAEYGDRGGKPVFLFHGLPGSRLFRHPDERIAAAEGLRVITVDRPGFGLSDPQPGRSLLHWPDDVAALADYLGLGRFGIIGLSAGGAYALACAYKIPRRLTTVGLIGSISPMNWRGAKRNMTPMMREFYMMAFRAPLLLRLVLWFGAREAQNDPQKYLSRFETGLLCSGDAAMFRQGQFRDLWMQSILETFRRGSTPFADEMIILSRPWRFRIREISIPVFLWHGEFDTMAPVQMSQYLADQIPASYTHFYKEEGFCVFFSRWREILATIAAEFVRLHD